MELAYPVGKEGSQGEAGMIVRPHGWEVGDARQNFTGPGSEVFGLSIGAATREKQGGFEEAAIGAEAIWTARIGSGTGGKSGGGVALREVHFGAGS